jgi:hypothetical protein
MTGSDVVRGFHVWATNCFGEGDDSFGALPWFPIEIEPNEWALWFIYADFDPGYLTLRGQGDALELAYSEGPAFGLSTPLLSLEITAAGVSPEQLVIKILETLEAMANSFSFYVAEFLAERLEALGEFFQQPRFQVSGLMLQAEGINFEKGVTRIALLLKALHVSVEWGLADEGTEKQLKRGVEGSLLEISEGIDSTGVLEVEIDQGAPSREQIQLAMNIAFPENRDSNKCSVNPFNADVIDLTISEDNDEVVLTHLLSKRIPKTISLAVPPGSSGYTFPTLVEGFLANVVPELLDILERAKRAKKAINYRWVIKLIDGKGTYGDDYDGVARHRYLYDAPAALAPYFMRWIGVQNVIADDGDTFALVGVHIDIRNSILRFAKIFPESPIPIFLAAESMAQVEPFLHMDDLVALSNMPIDFGNQPKLSQTAQIQKFLSAKPEWQAYSELFNEEHARKNIDDLFEAWDY